MGVMSCSKRGCGNIMCHTYVDDVGYVCHDCQKEFEKWLENGGVNPETEYQIKEHLKNFMNLEKIQGNDTDKISVTEFFRNHSR